LFFVLCCRPGVEAVADLKYSLILDEDEMVLIIQLLNARIVQMAHEDHSAIHVLTPHSALLTKLIDIRHAGIVAANMAGELK
jgi:hypothetical protein